MSTDEKIKLDTIENKIDEMTSKSGALDKVFGKVASRVFRLGDYFWPLSWRSICY